MPTNLNKIDTSAMTQAQLVEQYGRTRDARREGAAGAKDPGQQPVPLSTSDRADISDKARELVELRQAVDAGRAALVDAPDVRPDRLAQVRERLATGFYHSAEVRDQVAGRLGSLFLEGMLF